MTIISLFHLLMLHTLNKRPDYEKNCDDNYQLAVPLIDVTHSQQKA